MFGFVARQKEYVARLDADERAVLAGIASEVGVLLGAVPFRKAAREAAREAAAAAAAADQVDEADDEDELPASVLLEDDPPLSALGFAWQRPVERPSDPALRRLLPDASEDPEVAAEFRRLTDADLRERKIAGLRTWWQALRAPGGPQGDAVAVTAAEAPAVAAAMTDVRLVLADRLGIRTDDDGERIYRELSEPARGDTTEAMEVRRAFVGVYAMLSELQESLVGAMLAQSRARRTSQGGADGGRGVAG